MSRVFVDTHVFVWALSQRDRLRASTWQLLEDPALELCFSVASAWELAIKSGLGKLQLPGTAAAFVADGCRAAHVRLFAIDLAHIAAVEALPSHHRDPFDRMLVAQAQVEGVPIVSYDAALDAYGVERIG